MPPSISSQIQVPSPLPTTLPAALRTALMNHLLHSPDAIPSLQRALMDSLQATGWLDKLEQRIVSALEHDHPLVADVRGPDVHQKILESVVAAATMHVPGRGRKEPYKTNDERDLAVPAPCVDAAANVLRDVLGRRCVVVDERDFEVE